MAGLGPSVRLCCECVLFQFVLLRFTYFSIVVLLGLPYAMWGRGGKGGNILFRGKNVVKYESDFSSLGLNFAWDFLGSYFPFCPNWPDSISYCICQYVILHFIGI